MRPHFGDNIIYPHSNICRIVCIIPVGRYYKLKV
jgi:hypothetical protein